MNEVTPADMTPVDAQTVPDPASPSKHPTQDLNELVHQRGRLGILTVLATTTRADFTYLQTNLGLTRGNLGSHLDALATARFIDIEKGYTGRRARTWITITKAGRQALQMEMSALQTLLNEYDNLASSRDNGQ